MKDEWILQQFVSRISFLLLKLTTQAKGNISVYKQRPEHLWNSWNISWELCGRIQHYPVYLLGESLSNIVCLGNREASCYFWTGALMLFDTGWHGDGGGCLSSKHLQVMDDEYLWEEVEKNDSIPTKTFVKESLEWEMLTSLVGTRWRVGLSKG